MIGRLTGRIVDEEADGTVILDVRGVGYEMSVPLGTVGRVTPDAEGQVTFFIHTHVREDALLLYGFGSRDERAAFERLISISNIGPKIGMAILGTLSVAELAAAIARGETSKLTGVPGVGKKTAERIVLELKDKLLAPGPALVTSQGTLQARPAAPSAKADLLRGALTRMGYRPTVADRAVTTLGARVETEALADLVREALGVLSP